MIGTDEYILREFCRRYRAVIPAPAYGPNMRLADLSFEDQERQIKTWFDEGIVPDRAREEEAARSWLCLTL